MRLHGYRFSLLLLTCLASVGQFGLLLSPAAAEESRLAEQIDARLQTVWKAQQLEPAEITSDTEFIRRATLDLTGLIPRVAEIYEFQENDSPNRRAELIDDLLSRPRHSVHLANLWRSYLLSENIENLNAAQIGGFEEWLRSRFRDNVSYNQLVRELLLAEGSFDQVGPALYYSSLQVKPEELARSTSRTFLGVQLDCAQCHDHPFDDWKQTDFWSFAAFFAQISPQADGNGQMIQGGPQLTDLPTGEVFLPDSEEKVLPRYFGETEPIDTKTTTRRSALADWMTSEENMLFARATVNRVWSHLFGLGIVNPPDNFSSSNPPMDEELLDLIAHDFVEHQYDLRYLLRELTNTHAYQLSSRGAENEAQEQNDQRIRYFARHAMKPFTADQLYDGLAQATSQPLLSSAAGMFDIDPRRTEFIQKFKRTGDNQTDYQSGIPQALTLMNGTLTNQAVTVEESNILKALSAPFYTDAERINTLFLATLSHPPEEETAAMFLDYLNEQPDSQSKQAALGHILWALLNSAEFTMNY
ncbi:hypothetical protein Pla110_09100 [Polystyrenella longa]|uniref:Cytochrome c domain-containing protein n=1 Tax=Polystyrenella longa TaxID=2528007 RepID=A0A518CJ01_9PLAN|nr:DUF1549 and DUF1553 domain-containing protein [Polystyrenella longa]QDU79205.1 hypothetical protein Pla110_09100 [Polystyrenella longa]